jgi:hypothetical protein
MDGLIMDMNRFSSAIFVDMVQKLLLFAAFAAMLINLIFFEVQP